MSTSVYAGFQVAEDRLSFVPQGIEAQAEYYSLLLDQPITPEDIQVFEHIRDQYHGSNPRNQEISFAWFKVVSSHPLYQVVGSLCGRTYLEARHIHLECDEYGDGRTTDKAFMRSVLRACQLNPDAADLMDCMYWG
jgi:hypothetical protein